MMSTNAADLELMRCAALLDSNPAAAADRVQAILAADAANPAAQLLLATASRRLGDPARAAALLEPLARANPGSSALQFDFGRACAAANREQDAIAALSRAVELDPGFADAWRELAALKFAAGDVTGGDRAYREFEQRQVLLPELEEAFGALTDGRIDAAEAMLNARLARFPDDVVALRLLADAVARRDNLLTAERHLQASLALAPGYATARFDLANVYYAQHRPELALPLVERLLVTDPDNRLYLLLKARSLRLVGGSDEAIGMMERLVAAQPRDDAAWVLLGHLRREVGRQSDAVAAYRQAIAVRPDCAEAYWAITNLKTVRLAADELEAIRALLARQTIQGADRVRLEFALGKALEDARDYQESFEHYARGNLQHRLSIGYDPDATTDDMRRMRAVFSAAFFAERRGWGSERADPIFIVGLPRAGSTLLEQMLASHPLVEGTRELPDLSFVVAELVRAADPRAGAAYPESATAIGRAAIAAAADDYLARTQAHRQQNRPRFIDKMPGNFGHIGIVQLMFPNASIIDARRHPLGVGLSCFKQLFVRGLNFTYDLRELGRYIHDYTELMAHFDAVLPGRVHRVHHEKLVADPEGELRALLDYCRLPFEDSCLRFYENRRIVTTASSEQVRQPIYADSIDTWRNYEPWLGALKSAVGDLVDRYPAR